MDDTETITYSEYHDELIRRARRDARRLNCGTVRIQNPHGYSEVFVNSWVPLGEEYVIDYTLT